jgi:hypothetical protein
MSLEERTKPELEHHVGCFGEFNPEDQICRKFCALCIRCAIESDQVTKMEILEDLFYAEATNATTQ